MFVLPIVSPPTKCRCRSLVEQGVGWQSSRVCALLTPSRCVPFFVCVCVCVCVYVCVYVCLHVHACVRGCVHVWVRVLLCSQEEAFEQENYEEMDAVGRPRIDTAGLRLLFTKCHYM